jgi:hypothetical protein
MFHSKSKLIRLASTFAVRSGREASSDIKFLGGNSLTIGLAAPHRRRDADQGREGGIGAFQLKTWAGGDKFTCFGSSRWDEYLRRNMRTYSSTSREVLSALRITHVLKHNDASESGFRTTPSA